MQGSYRFVRLLIALASTVTAFAVAGEPSQDSKSVSEIPSNFTPKTESFDYVRRTEMIPMRDGVKLFTVILIPRGAKRAPILLTRTPYDADKLTGHAESSHLEAILHGYDNALEVIIEGGYLRVVQDVRGK